MREKMVWRYWCDFCRKGGCSRRAMVLHEKRCTMNPDRECGVCRSEKLSGQGLEHLRILSRNDAAELTGLEYDEYAPLPTRREVVERLMEAADGCPACVFAALRQTKMLQSPTGYGKDWLNEDMTLWRFDFPKEMQEFWKQKRDDDDYNDMIMNRY